jgi:beta-lactamase regulating signal transducer with metallopeptidase domain
METLLHHPLLTTLAQALLHSLWQVSLLAGLAWLTGQLAHSARMKHRIYLGAMLGSGAVFFLTLCYYLPDSMATSSVQITDLTALVGSGEAMVHKVAETTAPTAMSIGAVIYLVGLLVMLLHACLDLFGVARIRRQSSKASGDIASLFADLVQRWRPQLSGKVQLRLSSRVSSALTLGLLRPLIVLPIGIINQLTTEEVEAILLHELAHVLRRDHLWNALQTGIRLLFFYHPFIHWLSRKIDREREYACDDLVAGRIDRRVYAQSLLRVAQFSITHKNQFIMQAQGKTHFTNRIQRLFQPANPSAVLSRPQRWWLPLLLLPLLFTAALSAQRQAPESKEKTEANAVSQTTVFYLDGKRFYDLDKLEAALQPGGTMQSCEGDPELAKINAAEGTNYTEIMRFYNPGNAPAETDKKAPILAPEQVKEPGTDDKAVGLNAPAASQNDAPATYRNNDALDKEAERVHPVLKGKFDNKKPNFATFIDDTPVHYAGDDAGAGVIIVGEVVHLFDKEAPETRILNDEKGTAYDGIVRIKTTKDTLPPKENAAKAITLSDSILILINDQPYVDQDILNRIDPDAIKEIHVIKDPKFIAPYGKPYTGVIKVTLKKGRSVKDMPMPATSPQILTPGLEESMGPGFDYENTYLEIDGEQQESFHLDQLPEERIEGIEIIKDRQQLSAAGVDPKYRAAMFITTLKGEEKAKQEAQQKMKVERKKLEHEQQQLKAEQKRMKAELEQLKAEQKKVEKEQSKADGGGH